MRNVKPGKVRAKKFLGQHFLHDQSVAKNIVEALVIREAPLQLLEIGPGMGVLTQYLMVNPAIDLRMVEIDRDSVAYLKKHYPALEKKIIEGDFLKMDLSTVFEGRFSVIGNFPYNISSQIFFKVLEKRHQVDQVVCMLQKEVAARMAAPHGNKTYGILSVLMQAWFNIDLLFKVQPGVFTPPPNVISAVIRMSRNTRTTLGCDEALFVQVVKAGFNMRRKTLRNALKNLNLGAEITTLRVMDQRAEQLSVEAFIDLTKLIEGSRAAANH